MFLRKRMRKAFTNGVLDAHRFRCSSPMVMENEIRWAYEAGFREGRKVVDDNAALRRRVAPLPHHDGPLPPKTPRPYPPMTLPPAPRRPDPYITMKWPGT